MAKLSDVVVDRSDLLLNVCASTGLVAMDKIQVQTPKGRCEKLQSVDPARRGRSNVSLIYLLQRPRVSPNSVRGALVKLSTKNNRFPHTFSKAPCSGMPYITWPCPASSSEGNLSKVTRPFPRWEGSGNETTLSQRRVDTAT